MANDSNLPAREHQHQLMWFRPTCLQAPAPILRPLHQHTQLVLVLAATGKIATRQQGFARGCKTAFGHVGFRHITRKPLRNRAMFDALTENLFCFRPPARSPRCPSAMSNRAGRYSKARVEADAAGRPLCASLSTKCACARSAQVKSVTPGQQAVKVVNDELVDMLKAAAPLALDAVPPVGIRWSACGRVKPPAPPTRRRLRRRQTQSADGLGIKCPAAMEQLAVLGRQIDVETLPIIEGQGGRDAAAAGGQAGRV